MREVFINTGYSCDLNCLTCPGGRRSSRGDTQPGLETLLSQINNHTTDKNDLIYLAGGDPTLRQDLPQIIEAASGNGNYVSLYTPGLRIADRNYLVTLMHAGLKHISVPIFSHLPGVHDAITRTESSLFIASQGLRNIFSLRNNGFEVDVEIAIVITSLNYATLPQTVAHIAAEFAPKRLFIVQLESADPADQLKALRVNVMDNMQPILQALDVCKNFGLEVSLKGVPLCWMDQGHNSILTPLSYSSSGVITETIMYGISSERSKVSTKPRQGPCSKCVMIDRCSISYLASSCIDNGHLSAVTGQGAPA